MAGSVNTDTRHESRRSSILWFLIALFLCASVQAVEVEPFLYDWVMETYDLDPERTRVDIVHNGLDTRLVDPADVTVKPLSSRQPRGPFTILVTIEDEGERIDRGQIRLRVTHYAEVLVATAETDRHDLVPAEKFEKQLMDITSLREQPVTSVDDLAGQRATTNIRQGTILTVAALEPVPDIEVGREVTIFFQDEAFTISAPGKAVQTGWEGDRIRVRNLESGKTIIATVVDESSVAVQP
ncbi:flagellar basal body P-ring formation protein FlgA [candidate division GN15 bacterium]|nr:flagellar basal body P-ring formation protein FlgA [candidate division GN15 bacterium]